MRCLIVDDHSFTRLGIRRILQERYPAAEFEEVGCLSDALGCLHRSTFELVLADLSLPDGSGLDLIKEIRSRHPQLPILVVTMHSQLHYARRAMQLGASGYLTKDRAAEELAVAAERALAGKLYLPPELADELFAHSVQGNRDPLDTLSDREFEVLRGLASGRTVTELAQLLNLSVKTVSTYRSRLMEKLALQSQAELVSFGRAHLQFEQA